jgi:hypothetical protein
MPVATNRRLVAALLILGIAAAAESGAQQPPPRRPPARRPAPAPAKPDTTPKPADSTAAKAAETVPEVRTPAAMLFGTVFDSVHMAPLEGATVLVEGTSRSAQTTDKGVFRVDSIPPGKYRVRVGHELLDSLGLAMVTNEIELGDGAVRHPAVDSVGATLVECHPAGRRAHGPAAIIGKLLDADTEDPVKGPRVGGVGRYPSTPASEGPRLAALSGEDGVYRICGLPAQFEERCRRSSGDLHGRSARELGRGALVVQDLKIGSQHRRRLHRGQRGPAGGRGGRIVFRRHALAQVRPSPARW